MCRLRNRGSPRPKQFISITSISKETSNSDRKGQLSVGEKKVVIRGLPISSFADNLHLEVINATGSWYGVGGTN
jgi:hypothetical protein